MKTRFGFLFVAAVLLTPTGARAGLQELLDQAIDALARGGGSQGEITIALKDKQMRALFMKQAKEEYSEEAVQCWLDIQAFRKKPTTAAFQSLVKTYIGLSGDPEINIGGPTVKLLRTLYDKIELKGVKSGDRTLLRAVTRLEEEAKINLRDTFARLKVTREYKKWKSLRVDYKVKVKVDTRKSKLDEEKQNLKSRLTDVVKEREKRGINQKLQESVIDEKVSKEKGVVQKRSDVEKESVDLNQKRDEKVQKLKNLKNVKKTTTE